MTDSIYTAGNAKLIRDTLGIGLHEVKRAFELAETADFGGDVMHALGYLNRNALAINIKGDRHAHMLVRGAEFAEELRQRHPELDDVFPRAAVIVPAP